MKTSEKISNFLNFINECPNKYNFASEGMTTENKRTQDYLHAIEFEPHVEDRSKICTKLKASRMARREYKNVVEELEPIMAFLSVPSHKKAIDELAQVLGRVRKQERYHENRTYIPRVEK